jgi:anti-sigma regulatory factor (Ser/Thr protein kinase)
MTPVPMQHAPRGFRHEALFYAGERDFLRATRRFIRRGAEAGEPTLVVIAQRKIDQLREALDGEVGESVTFVDMAEVGANPGRIIPAWAAFVEANAGKPLRGIGEPIWPERTATELLECQRHERLLNMAFADASDFHLLCPYDVTRLPLDVLAEAERSHTVISQGTHRRRSDVYVEQVGEATLDAPLDEPVTATCQVSFTRDTLAQVRAMVCREAARAGMLSRRIAELVLAVNELATNSVRHAGGKGSLRVWRDGEAMTCEVRDSGLLTAPLADRTRPGSHPDDGRGLWLASQLCDLVQMRSSAAGTTVRLRMLCA